MGLSPSVLQLLIRLHGRQPFQGPVLTLGVQDVLASYEDLQALYRRERVVSAAVPAGDRLPSSSRYVQAAGLARKGYVHARTFFRTLGIRDYDDLDFSEVEGATLLHDLNDPVPSEWHGRYQLLIDGGTIEHIFNMRAVMANLVQLLQVGGSIVHVSPTSGWVNHGFYQLNPCFFFDFYQANGFGQFDASFIQLARSDLKKEARILPYSHSQELLDIDDRASRFLFVFRATKQQAVALRIPTQGYYQADRSDRLPPPPESRALGA